MTLRTNLAIAALAFIATAAFCRAADAHPHVWVTSRTTVLFKDGAITGVQHDWTFDEMYALMAIEGLDKNNDGIYDKEELKPLAQVNIDGLKDFDYFTSARAGKTVLKFTAPVDYWLDYTNKVLTLHFTLPLAEPIPAKGQTIAIQVADPSFFIAFDPAKDNGIKLSAAAPRGCVAKMPSVAALTTKQQNLSDALSGQLVAAGGANDGALLVSCPP